MIPAAVIAMLACARLGAIHAVVFGGFGPNALAQRIDQSEAKVLLTASCGLEGATKKIAYQPLVRGALELSERKPQKVLIWQRDELRWELDEAKGEVVWESAVKKARRDGVKAECVDVKSEEALYVIYTSGTTGAPKGVVRESEFHRLDRCAQADLMFKDGGHAVALSNSIRHTAGLRGPGDVSLAMSDIGWVTGHSYLCYGPLLVGSAVVLYEGKPIGTPDAGILWRLIEEYRINAIFTAPTALRAIRRDDPELKLLKAVGERGGLRSLRTLWLTGERSQPALTSTFQSLLTRYAVPNAIINDNWGLSEQGVPLTATSMLPSPSVPRPGFAGKPQPGMDVHCVDDEGHEVPCGTMGNMVLGLPLSPSSFRTLWRDEERFWGSYLRRFGGRWFDTGDAGVVDDDGVSIADTISTSKSSSIGGAIKMLMLLPVRPNPEPLRRCHQRRRPSSKYRYVLPLSARRILTLPRRHRTIPLHPPLHRRMLRSRAPRPSQRPPPLCLRNPLPILNLKCKQTLQRTQHPRPLTTRLHRHTRRHDHSTRWRNPKDEVGENAEEEFEGVGRGRREGGV